MGEMKVLSSIIPPTYENDVVSAYGIRAGHGTRSSIFTIRSAHLKLGEPANVNHLAR